MTDALTMNVDSLATGRSMFPLTTRVSLIGWATDRMPSPFREIDLSERISTDPAALVKKAEVPEGPRGVLIGIAQRVARNRAAWRQFRCSQVPAKRADSVI